MEPPGDDRDPWSQRGASVALVRRFLDGARSEVEMEMLGDLVDLPVADQQYELVWVMVGFVNFGPTLGTMLSGWSRVGWPGNHDWYDTSWGFSSVLEADGCKSVRFNIATN